MLKEFVSVDIMSTGSRPDKDDLLEIGAWYIRDGLIVDKFITLVQPQSPNLDKVGKFMGQVNKFTGLSLYSLSSAPPLSWAIYSLLGFCRDVPVVSYNVDSVFNMLQRKSLDTGMDFSLGCSRTGLSISSIAKKVLQPSYDTWLLDSFNLFDVAKHLDIGVSDLLPRGYYKSYITFLVYKRLSSLNPYEISKYSPYLLGKWK